MPRTKGLPRRDTHDADAARVALARRAAASLPAALARRELGNRRGVQAPLPDAVADLAARLTREGHAFEAADRVMDPVAFFTWCRAHGTRWALGDTVAVVMRAPGQPQTSFRLRHTEAADGRTVYSALIYRRSIGVSLFLSPDDAPSVTVLMGGGPPAMTAALLLLADSVRVRRRGLRVDGQAGDDLRRLLRAWFPDP